MNLLNAIFGVDKKAMQDARLKHEKDMADREEKENAAARKHEEDMAEKEAKQQERAAEIAKAARAQEAKIAKEAQQQKDKAEKEREERANKEKQKQREHEEAESKRKEEHEFKLEQHRLEMEAAREKEKAVRKQAMEEMWINAKEKNRKNQEKQRKAALKRVKEAIDDIDKQNKVAREALIDFKKQHEGLKQSIANQDRVIENWPQHKEKELETVKADMDKAFDEWDRNNKEIKSAIKTTGVHEDNICTFLNLTHGLIGETTKTQINANDLDTRLNIMAELLERQCQDKLTIDALFADQNLQRFVPILEKEHYTKCDELKCKNEDEFNDAIFSVCRKGINKQIQEWQDRHPNDVDPFDAFLAKYGLTKYKIGLEDAGLDGLESVQDIENDEDMDTLIKAAKIKPLHKKKLKRAINDVKNDNYKPPEPPKALVDKKENDDNDEEDIKPRTITQREERLLQEICLNPEIWIPKQETKIFYAKSALTVQTPILGRFFDKMDGAIKSAQKLLTITLDNKLNEDQMNAVEAVMDNVKPKAIEAPKEDDKQAQDEEVIIEEVIDEETNINDIKPEAIEAPKDDDKKVPDEDTNDDPSRLPDFEQRKAWQQGTKVQVFSKGNDKWYNGIIIKIFEDEEGEWLEIKYETGSEKRTKQVDRYGADIRDPVIVECRAITAAIMVDINVVNIMQDQFEVNSTTRDCLFVARGVEDSTKAIIICQSQMRQSMRLAGAILKLKPSNMTKDTQPLWEAVDKGIIHIIKTAIEMADISGKYFGFFLKFNQSLQRFISMNESDKDMPLMLSLECLKKDIKDFSAFQKTFNKNLQKLRNSCMSVIDDCVKQSKGADAFNKAKMEIQRTEDVYKQKKKAFNAKEDKLAAEFEEKCKKRAEDKAEAAKLDLQCKQLVTVLTDNEKYKKDYTERKLKLNDLNFDTFGDAEEQKNKLNELNSGAKEKEEQEKRDGQQAPNDNNGDDGN